MLVTTLAGCGNGSGRATPPAYAAMYEGLCATRARADDSAAARQVFFDRAHQRVHELAAETARRDRAVAGRLLEAKQAVEHDLTAGNGSLATDLDHLLDASRTAIKASGYRPPDSCKDNP